MRKQVRLGFFLLAMSVSVLSVPAMYPVAYAEGTKAAIDTSAPSGINSPQDLIQWMTYYYLHPQPDLLAPAVLYADQTITPDHTSLLQQGQAPLTAFVSRVFAQNPDKIPGYIAQLGSLSSKGKKIVWSALWWSNTVQGKEQLSKMLLTLPQKDQDVVMAQMAQPAEPIERMEIRSPEVLDELWGAFSATGDDKYVTRLMTALPWVYNSDGDYNKLTIGGAAKWSLASNAQQHPRVMTVCMKARETQPQLRKVLDQIIGDVKKPAAPTPKIVTPTAQ